MPLTPYVGIPAVIRWMPSLAPLIISGITGRPGQSGRCVLAASFRAARSASSPTRAAGPSAFLRSDGSSGTPGAGVVVAELRPHVLHEPAERRAGVADQRDHPLPRPGAAGALAVPDVQLAEQAQVPLDVGEVELACLVDPQPDVGHQSARAVVPGGGGELPAGRELLAPPGEQPGGLLGRRRDPQHGLLPAAGPVHLVDRAL